MRKGSRFAARIMAGLVAVVVCITSMPTFVLAEDEETIVIQTTSDPQEAQNDASGAKSAAEAIVTSLTPASDGEQKTSLEEAVDGMKAVTPSEDAQSAAAIGLLEEYCEAAGNALLNNDEAGGSDYEQKAAALAQAISDALAAGEKIDGILEGVFEESGRILVAVPVFDGNGMPVMEQKTENGEPVWEKDEDGENKLDAEGNPIPVFVQMTKTVDLTDQINALKDPEMKERRSGAIDAAKTAKSQAEAAQDGSRSYSERTAALGEAGEQLQHAEEVLVKLNQDVDTAKAAKDAAEQLYLQAQAEADEALANAEEAQEIAIKGMIKDANAAKMYLAYARGKAEELEGIAKEAQKELANAELLEQITQKHEEMQAIYKESLKDQTDFKEDEAYRFKAEELCRLIIGYYLENVGPLEWKSITEEIGTYYEIVVDYTTKGLGIVDDYELGDCPVTYTDPDLSLATLENNMYTLASSNPHNYKVSDEILRIEEDGTIIRAYTDELGWVHSNEEKDNRIFVKLHVDMWGDRCIGFNYHINDDGTVCIYSRQFGLVEEYHEEVPATPTRPGIHAYTSTVTKWQSDQDAMKESPILTDFVYDDNGNIIGAANTDAYSYLKLIGDYNARVYACAAANAEVEKAQNAVESLIEQTGNIRKYSYDASKLTFLKQQLDVAKQELQAAIDDRNALQKAVNEAKEAILKVVIQKPASPAHDSDPDSDESSGNALASDAAVPVAGVSGPVLTVLPTTAAAGHVAGIRTVATAVEESADAEDAAGETKQAAVTESAPAKEEAATLEDETLPAAAEATTTLDDADLVAAAQPAGADVTLWMIFGLVVVFAGAAFGVFKLADCRKKTNMTGK
ncbi:MAG: hypothetical protein IKS87_00310 [Lachnospiraceae bacterium]|nr:hypothetical protein [Lachnospiraceae bacterium]